MAGDLNDYIDRHRNWQNKAIEQLSFANNLLLTISTGLLVFIFDKNKISEAYFCFCNINWSLTLYSLSLFSIILATFVGFIALISRLYDFRLSRHIALIRKRFYEKNQDEEKLEKAVLPANDHNPPGFWKMAGKLCKVIFCRIDFLTKEETKTSKYGFPLGRFNNIRESSFVLGVATWRLTKFQCICLLMGVLFYGASLWTA